MMIRKYVKYREKQERHQQEMEFRRKLTRDNLLTSLVCPPFTGLKAIPSPKNADP